MSLNDHDTNGKWHGKNTFSFLRSFEAKVMKKINKTKDKTNRSKLMACIIHSIEDWHAHSYAVFINYYRKNYSKYSPNDLEVKYHKDRKAKVRNNKIIGLEKFDSSVHSKFKDNENKDFNKKTGKWSNCTFDSNKRIKKAINECVKFLKG